MSHDLRVKLTKNVALREVIAKAENWLRDILRGEGALAFTTYEVEGGQVNLTTDDRPLVDEFLFFLVCVSGTDDVVEFSIMDNSQFYPEEKHHVAALAVRGDWPLKFATAASLAVALAELQNTEIEDEGNIWVKSNLSDQTLFSVQEFAKTITLTHQYNNIFDAADRFRKLMPFHSVT